MAFRAVRRRVDDDLALGDDEGAVAHLFGLVEDCAASLDQLRALGVFLDGLFQRDLAFLDLGDYFFQLLQQLGIPCPSAHKKLSSHYN